MTGQSRLGSMIEAVVNIFTGMVIAFSLSQLACLYQDQIRLLFYSDFSWNVSPESNVIVTVVLTIVSVIRSYIWRRIFNHHHVKRSNHGS